jgi:hypothetical protein
VALRAHYSTAERATIASAGVILAIVFLLILAVR